MINVYKVKKKKKKKENVILSSLELCVVRFFN